MLCKAYDEFWSYCLDGNLVSYDSPKALVTKSIVKFFYFLDKFLIQSFIQSAF